MAVAVLKGNAHQRIDILKNKEPVKLKKKSNENR